jgi:hypothetical protein
MSQRISGIRQIIDDAFVTALPDGVSVERLATQCRQALLEVMVSGGWGKLELARWLAGPYRHATAAANARVETESLPTGAPRRPSPLRRHVRGDAVSTLVQETRERVALALAGSAPRPTDVAAAHYSGLVARCRDGAGRAGWMPVDRKADGSAMGLYERVMSLAIADYLIRPADYLGMMSICRTCGTLSFDVHCRAENVCTMHMPSLHRLAVR